MTNRPSTSPVILNRRTLLLASAAGLLGTLTACGSDEAAALPPVEPGYPDATLFLSTSQISSGLNDPDLVVLDCSELATYRRGHIPGARHVWWQDTIEIHNPAYGMLVNPEGRARLAEEAGVSPDSRVVCYDDSGGVYAARVAWTLRYMGFQNTAILPGGTRQWRSAGHDLTRKHPEGAEGGIPDIFDESIVAHPQDIVARMNEPGLVFLDTRTAGERNETWNGRLREGRIPGSVWIPRDRWLDENGIPVDAGTLWERLSDVLEPDTTAEIIVYGLHGTMASLPYYMILALDRFLVRLYDGSWSQWGADASLPIEPLEG